MLYVGYFRLTQIEIKRSRLMWAVFLNFILWGSGGLLLKRDRIEVFAIALHIYLYILFLLIGVWLLWFPIFALGGAYFALDIDRRFKKKK